MARVARWMPAAALALWVAATGGQAAALRATPPGALQRAGPVLGIE